MKTISIFQVQDINNLLKQKNYDYTLKLHDACGSQSLFLQCHGNNCDINELCDVINDYLKNVEFNIDDYETTCKYYTEDSLSIELKAEDKDGKVITYEIPLVLNENCSSTSS